MRRCVVALTLMLSSLMLNMDTVRNEFLDSDRVANVYFTSTSDVDAKSRISSLHEFYRINLNDIRRLFIEYS